MIDLYNGLKFITMLFFIQKILTFNLGVAFLKSVSILLCKKERTRLDYTVFKLNTVERSDLSNNALFIV